MQTENVQATQGKQLLLARSAPFIKQTTLADRLPSDRLKPEVATVRTICRLFKKMDEVHVAYCKGQGKRQELIGVLLEAANANVHGTVFEFVERQEGAPDLPSAYLYPDRIGILCSGKEVARIQLDSEKRAFELAPFRSFINFSSSIGNLLAAGGYLREIVLGLVFHSPEITPDSMSCFGAMEADRFHSLMAKLADSSNRVEALRAKWRENQSTAVRTSLFVPLNLETELSSLASIVRLFAACNPYCRILNQSVLLPGEDDPFTQTRLSSDTFRVYFVRDGGAAAAMFDVKQGVSDNIGGEVARICSDALAVTK